MQRTCSIAALAKEGAAPLPAANVPAGSQLAFTLAMNCENIDAATNLRLEQLAFSMTDALGRFETFVAGSDGHAFLLAEIAREGVTAPDTTPEQLADCLYAHALERDSMLTDDDHQRLRDLAARLGATAELDDFAYLQERVREEFGAQTLSANRTMTLSAALRGYVVDPLRTDRDFKSRS